MTHTEVKRNVRSLGNLAAEELEIDISALDSAGTETGVAPSGITEVRGFYAHVAEGAGEVVSYDETNGELEITDGSGAEVANDASLNVIVTWVGDPAN